MLILPNDCQIHRRCPRLWMCGLCCHTLNANSMEVLKCTQLLNFTKIWSNFLKRMHDNRKVMESYATKSYPLHKIVHSSAMYYQNLNVIHKSSKKLLTIKSVKFIFKPSICGTALQFVLICATICVHVCVCVCVCVLHVKLVEVYCS